MQTPDVTTQATTNDIDPRLPVQSGSICVGITRFTHGESVPCDDSLALEEPLEITLEYGPAEARQSRSIAVTMRTPGHDAELVAGFLLTEGVVRDAADIVDIFVPADGVADSHEREDLSSIPQRNSVRVSLAHDVVVNMAGLERNFYTTSSCGICGKASLLALRAVCPSRAANTFETTAKLLYGMPDILREQQQVFERTGGLHACGLFDESGALLSLREDVGRHNALDKLLGAEFLADRAPLRRRMLLLSGRASFELLQKSVMAALPLVASVGAPSSLAVQVAREFDITLIGFLRGNGFNVYHGAHRIQCGAGA